MKLWKILKVSLKIGVTTALIYYIFQKIPFEDVRKLYLKSVLMKVLALSILLLTIIGCRNVTSEKSISQATDTTYQVNKTNGSTNVKSSIVEDSLFRNTEYLGWDSVKINGQVPFIAKVGDLYKLIGQPDSVINGDTIDNCGYYYYDKAVKLAYINGTEVEVLRDSGVVRTIDFGYNTKTYLQTPKIRLDRNTTLEALERLFPEAVKAAQEEPVRGGKKVSVRLEISKKPMEDAWLLFFQNHKLVRIVYHVPC